MPPARSSETSNLVFFTYKRRKVTFARPATHEDAVNLAKKTFPALKGIPPERIGISARLPDHREEGVVEIAPEAWQLATNGVKHFTVGIIEEEIKVEEVEEVKKEKEEEVDLMQPLNAQASAQPRLPTLKCQDRPAVELEGHRTLASYGITKGATLHLILPLKGGKPVIYLYPPSSIDASVKLSLVPHWRFSALYPMPEKQATQGGKQCRSVKWNVVCDPNGVMTVKGTPTKVAYLFWEAETDPTMTNPNPQNSPGPTRSLVSSKTQEFYPRNGFIPGVTKCSSQDSVVLSVHDVASYLDRCLTSLGLHVEARTSFITYWLPSILKHEFVAIRFLPQVDYQASAPLEINPLPDVVTRVFMLFQGIPPDRLSEWQEAQERSSKDVGFWVAIVGVDGVRQRDTSLFRVLEWGGMEVF